MKRRSAIVIVSAVIVVFSLLLLFQGSNILKSPECVEDWICEEYSECVGGKSVRFCYDSNDCGTFDNVPEVEKVCGEEVEENQENQEVQEAQGNTGGIVLIIGISVLVLLTIIFIVIILVLLKRRAMVEKRKELFAAANEWNKTNV